MTGKSSSNDSKKIIIAVIVAVVALGVLAVAFFAGGNYPGSDSSDDSVSIPIEYENAGLDPDNIPDGTCTISVSCANVLKNMDLLKSGKKSIIPEDGVILKPTKVEFKGGDTVFDVLYSVLRENKIHFEYSESPLYKSVYIEGINNLYEFDCGELSGWMYCVNNKYAGVGCSRCYVQDGDEIKFMYTCDLGEDLGVYFDSDQQKMIQNEE